MHATPVPVLTRAFSFFLPFFLSYFAFSNPFLSLFLSKHSEHYHHDSNIPPPMTLTEQSEAGLLQSETPVYGSLRDSHLEGKFLDGPASYRDRSSGRLHPLRHNQQIRLDDSATSYHAPSSLASRLVAPSTTLQKGGGMGDWSRLTPGERILAATTTTPPTASKPPTTSTLSSMMQGDPLPQQATTTKTNNNSTATTTASSTASSGGLYHPEHEEDANAVLSTSLTGFEILKAASQHPELLQGRPTKSMPTYSMPSTTGFMPQPPSSLSPQEQQHHQDYLDEEDEDDDLFELDME
jgi:hypothetical protein